MATNCQTIIIVISLFICASYVVQDSPSNRDYVIRCKHGYRLSSIKRSKLFIRRIGSLTIECQKMEDVNPDRVICDRLQDVPQCSGIAEGCFGESWLSGFHAYIIENSTDALLLDPICCTTNTIHIDEKSCINDRLNEATKSFDHAIANDLVYRGLQCWHQYNNDNVLFDIIWKMEICSFISAIDHQGMPRSCQECDCRCGFRKCINGYHPVRIIHKEIHQYNCECRCDCTLICM